MRVISGKAKRTVLKTVEGTDTRPTTDRIKETLFNIINPFITDCNFLDLFSGSGAIGIEALSRGANSCVFIEKNRQACDCIRQNLVKTKLEEDSEVLEMDVFLGLNKIKGQIFDLIFMDPPYKLNIEEEVLQKIIEYGVADFDTQIIIEADINRSFDFVSTIGYKIIKEKTYKTNKHVFICIER